MDLSYEFSFFLEGAWLVALLWFLTFQVTKSDPYRGEEFKDKGKVRFIVCSGVLALYCLYVWISTR